MLLAYLSPFRRDNREGRDELEGTKELEEEVRELVRDLGRVKRDQVIPGDLEREMHEKEHEEFGLEETEERGMEGLVEGIEGIGLDVKGNGLGGTKTGKGIDDGGVDKSKSDDGEELLEILEGRLRNIEEKIRRQI